MVVKHSAKLLLLDSENNALILRRSESHPHIPLTSDLPGGEIESGETPAVAACRETFEETGINLEESVMRQIGKRQFKAFGREYDLYLFVAKVSERPDVKISWEHDQYSWIPLDEVQNLDDGFQPLVTDYLKTNRA